MIFWTLILLSYLIGTTPSGMIIAKLHGVKITEHGSGNTGATNVARVVGKQAGILTLLLDVLKGVVASLLGILLLQPEDAIWCSVAVTFGHCFSIPYLLKGGKGVATALGVLIAVEAQLAFFALVIFGIIFYLKRIVSLSSVCAVFSAPLISFFLFPDSPDTKGLIIMAILLIARHYSNLHRLIDGTEPKFTTS